MTDEVARALCRSAGQSISSGNDRGYCVYCECPHGETRPCTMWPQFRDEARAAILAAYTWHKREKRWPSFVKETR